MWKTNNYFDTSIGILELVCCVAVTQHRAHTDIFILQFSVSSITWHTEIAKHTTAALLCDEIDIRFENGFSNAVLTSHLKWDNNKKIVLIPNRNSHTNNRVSFTHIRYESFCVRRLLCRQVSASISSRLHSNERRLLIIKRLSVEKAFNTKCRHVNY